MLRNANDDDIDKFNMGEDAPQIVGIIDDRPPELIAREDYNKSRMWKTLGTESKDEGKTSAGGTDERTRSRSPNQNKKRNGSADASPVRRSGRGGSREVSTLRKCDKNSDASPPRRRKRSASTEASPRRHRKSPARRPNRSQSRDESPPRRAARNPDASPSRRRRRNGSRDASPRRRDRSPLRKPNGGRDRNDTRSRKEDKDRDSSSPRRRVKSPARRSNRSGSRDESPLRRNVKDCVERKWNMSPDTSARRCHKSPMRKRNRRHEDSPPRRLDNDRDASPPRRQRNNSSETSPRFPPTGFNSRKKQLSESPPPTHKKMIKTLDGKIAGLQNATALRDENEKFKKREEELYKHMTKGQPDEMEAQVRKTGRRRNLEQNSEKEMEKMLKAEERKAIYDRWGKGLKQIEDFQERVADEMHEHSKPLARYANDADLDDYLKKQYRDGDPMAEYFQTRSKETGVGPCKCTFNFSASAPH